MEPDKLMGKWSSERQLLWEVTREMVQHGLVTGSNGNASMRLGGNTSEALILVTPTGLAYRDLKPEDLVIIDLDGEDVEGSLIPSSETTTHLEMYKMRGDIGAIMHTHSTFASVAAVAGLEIPPVVDEMVIKVGGSVKVAEYGFPSSEELAQRATAALGDRKAVLLRNHGLVAVGHTPWEALEVCELVEQVAKIFIYASMVGKATFPAPEMLELEQELFRMREYAKSPNTGNNYAQGDQSGYSP